MRLAYTFSNHEDAVWWRSTVAITVTATMGLRDRRRLFLTDILTVTAASICSRSDAAVWF